MTQQNHSPASSNSSAPTTQIPTIQTTSTSTISTENTLLRTLSQKYPQLIEIERLYGTANVEEALQVLKVNETSITKRANFFENIEQVSKELEKINGNPRWTEFKFDLADGEKLSLKSIEESIAAIACEEQNILNGLKRAKYAGADFIDNTGKPWDIKSFRSIGNNGRRVFNIEKHIESIKKELLGTESIILNTLNLIEDDWICLSKAIKSDLSINEIKRIIIIDSKYFHRSMNNEKLLQFLGL